MTTLSCAPSEEWPRFELQQQTAFELAVAFRDQLIRQRGPSLSRLLTQSSRLVEQTMHVSRSLAGLFLRRSHPARQLCLPRSVPNARSIASGGSMPTSAASSSRWISKPQGKIEKFRPTPRGPDEKRSPFALAFLSLRFLRRHRQWASRLAAFPNWRERTIHEFMNRSRVDPASDLAACPATACLEKSCYDADKPALLRSELGSGGALSPDEMKQQNYFAHDSACTVVSNISSIYPGTCKGAASCACQGGTKACASTCTAWSGRAPLLTPASAAKSSRRRPIPEASVLICGFTKPPRPTSAATPATDQTGTATTS